MDHVDHTRALCKEMLLAATLSQIHRQEELFKKAATFCGQIIRDISHFGAE